ncbi:ice-binding family protein [Promicromonospora iranensis]|uniref:Membrane protein YgcG n=1 Tax=Promicromonospora iranensis TaxID=1105144 RepID=A0ABU2CW75_9MICO|nr:ice-binding family protein [Promicromonospora iranensis]MDR7385593.1 putative membrane protein YgcG [Promicromonospora iranensis]
MGTALALGGSLALVLATQQAWAIGTPVDLGTAGTYSVLGGQTVTNTGPSVLSHNVGVSPGTAITGFPPGLALGDTHAADAHALQAQSDLVTAYNDAAGQAPDESISGDLGGLTLEPGVYNASSSIGLTGTLTLDAQGDPDAVFIFQVGSALTTASASSVELLNDAQACNVFWQIGSSATLGTDTTFVGTIMALTSISVTTGTTVDGRALARNGSVTLDSNVFTRSACESAPPTSPPPTGSPSPSDNPTGPPTDGPTTPPTGGPTPPPTPPGDGGPGDGNGAPGGPDDGNGSGSGDGSGSGSGSGDGSGAGGPGGAGGAAGAGGGDRGSDTLAATGPSVNAPLLTASIAAILAGVGLIATSLRMHRRRP